MLLLTSLHTSPICIVGPLIGYRDQTNYNIMELFHPYGGAGLTDFILIVLTGYQIIFILLRELDYTQCSRWYRGICIRYHPNVLLFQHVRRVVNTMA